MPTAEDTDLPGPIWARGEPRIAGATHVGSVRQVNQDAFGRFDDEARSEILLVVADGLGGHLGGEVASRMAVERIGEFVRTSVGDPDERLRSAIEQANDDILDRAREDPSLDGMGTTVVCLLLVEDGRSWVAHVGDSRLYRLRGGSIRCLTEDHSLIATLVREGVLTEAQARDDPRRNQILRALGVREDVELDLGAVELQPGDVYLLCSDGLHGLIEDEEIQRLADHSSRPEAVVKDLIEAANAAGGTDNVTGVVVQIPEPMPIEPVRGGAGRLLERARALLTRPFR